MVKESSRQTFNKEVKIFTCEIKFVKEKKKVCTKIIKSNLSNCTLCRKTKMHKMRIHYAQCNVKDCSNNEKPCFKMLSCPLKSLYTISASALHYEQSRLKKVKHSKPIKKLKRIPSKRTDKSEIREETNQYH